MTGLLRRLLRVLLRVVVFVVVFTVAQVVLVRFFDPPITATMAMAWWEERGRTGTWPPLEHRSVRLDDQGPWVPRAVVASEDANFWHHHGFDFGAIRDVIDDHEAGARGASTLSQQTARNVFLWQGRTWVRKGLEAWYTLWLELLVPKGRILEVYLNVAQTGPLTFGFEAGARHWYGVSAKKLSRTQAAQLAAILPSPARRDPRAQVERAAHIVANEVPFPGEPGFDRAARLAAPSVSPEALIAPSK